MGVRDLPTANSFSPTHPFQGNISIIQFNHSSLCAIAVNDTHNSEEYLWCSQAVSIKTRTNWEKLTSALYYPGIMQFHRVARNYQSSSSLQIPNGLNLELCGNGSQADLGIVLDEKGCVDGDDLSAVVKKYKKNTNQGFGPSQLQVVPQFHQFHKEEWVTGGGGEIGFEMKGFVNGGSFPLCSSSAKEIHSFSERVRRTEMNQLFAEMNSLLPSSAVKRSKACIVSDIVDYIESLQRQLALYSSQNAGPKMSGNADSTIPPFRDESKQENEFPSSDIDRKSMDENLNVIYNGKDIFITVKYLKKANVLTSLIYAVESHNIQVTNGFATSTDTVAFYCLHAKVTQILSSEAKEILYGNLRKLMKSEFKISLKSE